MTIIVFGVCLWYVLESIFKRLQVTFDRSCLSKQCSMLIWFAVGCLLIDFSTSGWICWLCDHGDPETLALVTGYWFRCFLLRVFLLVGAQGVKDGAEHLSGPLGERVVGVAGCLVTVVGILSLVKSITVTGVRAVASEERAEADSEKREDEGAEDKGKQAEDHGVLDGGGIECDGGGARAAYTNVAQPGVPFLLKCLGRGHGGHEAES